MSGGAVCPACGVAVVPGYVRCPKCHKPLPQAKARAGTKAEGGTALESRGPLPIPALIAVGVVGVVVVLYLALRGGKHPEAEPTTAEPTEEESAATGPSQPTPSEAPARPTQPTGPTGDAVAADLERALKKQRLWSTVSVVGDRVEVRSGLCAEAGMKATVEGSLAAFKAAGLTRLRCLEESGQVVFDRDF